MRPAAFGPRLKGPGDTNSRRALPAVEAELLLRRCKAGAVRNPAGGTEPAAFGFDLAVAERLMAVLKNRNHRISDRSNGCSTARWDSSARFGLDAAVAVDRMRLDRSPARDSVTPSFDAAGC